MSLMTEILCMERFTWQLLFGVHEEVIRRKLSNSAALEALSRFCVTDESRLQIEAELEAHLLPLTRQHEEVPPPKPRTRFSVPPNTKSHWKTVKKLNGICAGTCIRTADLISLSLWTMVELYQALIANPTQYPSARHLQQILAYVSYPIRIWAETADGQEYRGLYRPELKRNDRRLARAAHMQYCGQILLIVCRMTWPDDQLEWIEQQQIIFDKEVEDFSEAFIFDGSLTYKYILEVRKTVLDSGGPRSSFIILQKLDRWRHDGDVKNRQWYRPDPALPLLQDFVDSTARW
ncbi:hypothetical protein ACKVV1_010890 [Pyricularia oryzae]